VRVEQLYPFPEALLGAEVGRYPNVAEYVWCQEEPLNQGAWYSIQHHIRSMLNGEYLHYAGRPASASPAVGSAKIHVVQQKQLVEDAFNPINEA